MLTTLQQTRTDKAWHYDHLYFYCLIFECKWQRQVTAIKRLCKIFLLEVVIMYFEISSSHIAMVCACERSACLWCLMCCAMLNKNSPQAPNEWILSALFIVIIIFIGSFAYKTFTLNLSHSMKMKWNDLISRSFGGQSTCSQKKVINISLLMHRHRFRLNVQMPIGANSPRIPLTKNKINNHTSYGLWLDTSCKRNVWCVQIYI